MIIKETQIFFSLLELDLQLQLYTEASAAISMLYNSSTARNSQVQDVEVKL